MPNKDIEKRREAYRKWYYKSKENRNKVIKRSAKKKLETKQWLVEYKEKLGCSKCNEKHPAALDFHHENDDKEFNVAEAWSKGYGKDKVLAEISKCIVLCANCHRKEHWNKTH